jgi:hypothetical protein
MTTATTMTPLPSRTLPGGPSCPQHQVALDGGPVLFHCPAGRTFGHSVYAADLSREVTLPATGRAA